MKNLIIYNYIHYFCVADQISDRNSLRKDGFTLAHSCREFSLWSLSSLHLGRTPWWQENVVENSYLPQVSQESERDTRWNSGQNTPKDLSPVTYFQTQTLPPEVFRTSHNSVIN
jgi:hypothetical protein